MKLTETYLRKVIKEEVEAVLQEGLMDKTLDFFGKGNEGGRAIRMRARELKSNPNWDSSSLKGIYGKKIDQIIAAGNNEAVNYADILKTIEDQFEKQIDNEIELNKDKASRDAEATKRKDIFWNSIENKNKKDADKARNDKEFYDRLRTDNEEREFRGTPEYHDQFRTRVGGQDVAITPNKIKTRPDPRYKGK